MDLYIFARALFNKKLRAAGLTAENPTLWDAQHPDASDDNDVTMQEKVVEELASKTKEDLKGERIISPSNPFRRRRRR